MCIAFSWSLTTNRFPEHDNFARAVSVVYDSDGASSVAFPTVVLTVPDHALAWDTAAHLVPQASNDFFSGTAERLDYGNALALDGETLIDLGVGEALLVTVGVHPLDAFADEGDALSTVTEIGYPQGNFLNTFLGFVVRRHEDIDVEVSQEFHLLFGLYHVEAEHVRRNNEELWVGVLSAVAEGAFLDPAPQTHFTVDAIASVANLNQMLPMLACVDAAPAIMSGCLVRLVTSARSDVGYRGVQTAPFSDLTVPSGSQCHARYAVNGEM